MIISKIACIVFSPTGGCLKIANSLKNTLDGYNFEIYNVTSPKSRNTLTILPEKIDYMILIFPIYADTLPDILKSYLNNLLFYRNIPVTVIAGYGNISIGKALFDSKNIFELKGNIVCSACTIVIAHSYNGSNLKIAENEPSKENLDIIQKFIQNSIFKIGQLSNLNMGKIEIPKGKMRFLSKAPQKLFPHILIKTPNVIEKYCNHCNICVNVCPTGAINNELLIENKKCIRCLACVRNCTKKARLFNTRTQVLFKVLAKDSKNIKENAYYI